MKMVFIIICGLISINLFAITATPVVHPPVDRLNEGIQSELTSDQITTITPWATNIRHDLRRVKLGLVGLDKKERNNRLVIGIRNAVKENSHTTSVLLMRYVLNRGLAIHRVLLAETSESHKGVMEARNRVLNKSITFALKFYKSDLKMLKEKKISKESFAKFAGEYSLFLGELNRSIMDASAKYIIERINLGFLQWDLYRSAKKSSFAVQINDIYEYLKLFSKTPYARDQVSIAKIKELKKMRYRIYKSLGEKNKVLKRVVVKKLTLREKILKELRLVRIPRGSFYMGSRKSEQGRVYDEKRHKVTITHDFYMATTEITQKLWFMVMKSNPSHFYRKNRQCPKTMRVVGKYSICPKVAVNNISWVGIQKFIKKLNKLAGMRLRLPTEAEWEYAARAGDKGSFPRNIKRIYSVTDSYKSVDSFTPNAWGLYGMLEGVSEFVFDAYSDKYQYLSRKNPVKKRCMIFKKWCKRVRVVKGGTHFGNAHRRYAYRRGTNYATPHWHIGFRLVTNRY